MAHSDTEDQRRWWRSPKATSVIALSLGVVTVAERDLRKRPSSEIRGSKLLWRLISLNAIGALAYLFWGRSTS
jgi:hypothetical protein